MRVLVVEDEHLIANSIKKGLEQEKYVVDLAYDGQTGYDLATSEEYDLILLDLMLPVMDGMIICKKLREEKIQTPILILTARGQVKDKVNGLDAGADDYLAKPFSFEELLARIRALSRRPREVHTPQLCIGSLKLNPKTFAVERDGKTIKISRREFMLLEFLMRHAGQILSKEQIINHVWDYDADVLPNTVEVNIKNLRSKIDQPFPGSKPLIQTIRGFGYKLGEE